MVEAEPPLSATEEKEDERGPSPLGASRQPPAASSVQSSPVGAGVVVGNTVEPARYSGIALSAIDNGQQGDGAAVEARGGGDASEHDPAARPSPLAASAAADLPGGGTALVDSV